MDKVKSILAVAKKQHFWVMSALVLVISLLGWLMATSKLWAEYKTNRGKIDAEFKELEGIRGKECENEKWIEGIHNETQALRTKVKDAWEIVYNEQRDKVLKWPKSMGPAFLELVPKLQPSEEIPIDLREQYRNFAQEEFPELLKIVDAQNLVDKTPDAMLGRAPGNPQPRRGDPKKPIAERKKAEHEYKVVWDTQSQKHVHDLLALGATTPNTQEVRQIQEDLWVYQALLKIIANLNSLADGRHNAKVKEIQKLSIGKEAATEFQDGLAETGRLEHADTAQASSGTGLGSAMTAGPPMGAARGGPSKGPGGPAALPGPPGPATGGGKSGEGGQGNPLDEGRYVDEKGMPLAAGALAPAEFKRMPVVMQLLIDQREISHLLVECANSPLPVEVRRLRITSTKNSGQGNPGGPGGRGGGRAAGGPMRGPMVAGGGAVGNDEERDKNPYEVQVELHGIIYIFNPPDPVKLALIPATDASGEAAPGEPPAAAPAEPAAVEPAAPENAAAPEGAAEPAAETDAAGEADSTPEDAPAADAGAAEPDGAEENPPPADETEAMPAEER